MYDSFHLRFWGLSGSMDALPWTELDRRENDTQLNRQGNIGAFSIGEGGKSRDVSDDSIRKRNRQAFRMIRLQQTRNNSRGRDELVLTIMVFFGDFTAPGQ
jgi:hypothetical protein